MGKGDGCPEGYNPITDGDECEDALRSFNNTTLNKKQEKGFCYIDYDDKGWNNLKDSDGATYICKFSPTYKFGGKGKKTCPENHVKITGVSECEIAFDKLNVTI